MTAPTLPMTVMGTVAVMVSNEVLATAGVWWRAFPSVALRAEIVGETSPRDAC